MQQAALIMLLTKQTSEYIIQARDPEISTKYENKKEEY